MQNRLAHFRERLRTSHYWHVNNSNLISVYVNPLICNAYIYYAKNQGTAPLTLCIAFHERCDSLVKLGRVVEIRSAPA